MYGEIIEILDAFSFEISDTVFGIKRVETKGMRKQNAISVIAKFKKNIY